MNWITPKPILINELKALARNRRVHLLRILYLMAFLLSLFILLPGLTFQGGTGNVQSQLSRKGSQLFYLFVVCQSVGLGILAPALSAGVVAKEKENRTFELLLTTDLGASEIVWHKVTSHIFALTILLASSAPVLFICMLFGGVAAYEVLGFLGFVVGFTLICCGLAAFFSAICRTTAGSILMTYLAVVGGVIVGPPVCGLVYDVWVGGRAVDDVLSLCSYFNIFICYVGLIDGQMPSQVSYWAWLTAEGTALAVFLISILLGSRLAPKSLEWQPRRFYTRIMEALDRFYEGNWLPDWLPKPRLLEARAPVKDNPILWRECHTNVFGRRAYFIRIGLAAYVAVGLLAILAPDSFTDRVSQMLIFSLEHIALVVLLIVCGAATIAKERQNRTLALILSTPLTPWRILGGKIVGVVRKAIVLMALIVLHLEVLRYMGSHIWYGWRGEGGPNRCLCLINVLVFGAFFLSLGMTCSALCKNTARATLAALFISLGVILLPVVLGVILDEFTSLSDAELIHGLSPAYWVVALIERPYAVSSWSWQWVIYPCILTGYGIATLVGLIICRRRLDQLAAEA